MRKWTPDMTEAYARKTERELAARGITLTPKEEAIEEISVTTAEKKKPKKFSNIFKKSKEKHKKKRRS